MYTFDFMNYFDYQLNCIIILKYGCFIISDFLTVWSLRLILLLQFDPFALSSLSYFVLIYDSFACPTCQTAN